MTGGHVNVYRTTLPKAIARELPEQWHADSAPAHLQAHVAVIDQAIEDASARAERDRRLRLQYVDAAA